MAECILGIKCNGASIRIDTLGIDTSQSGYDFICNVSHVSDTNGNGRFDVSIVNEDLVQGFPIGKWRIVKAYLNYDWGASYAKFIMTDDRGDETKEIIASEQRGSASGFNINTLARSIFVKAQKIVSEYPSALLYNKLSEFEAKNSDYTWKYISNEYPRKYQDKNEYISFIDYLSKNVIEYVGVFKKLKGELDGSDDHRANILLSRITNECVETLRGLPFKNVP